MEFIYRARPYFTQYIPEILTEREINEFKKFKLDIVFLVGNQEAQQLDLRYDIKEKLEEGDYSEVGWMLYAHSVSGSGYKWLNKQLENPKLEKLFRDVSKSHNQINIPPDIQEKFHYYTSRLYYTISGFPLMPYFTDSGIEEIEYNRIVQEDLTSEDLLSLDICYKRRGEILKLLIGAHTMMESDVDYIIRDNQIYILDSQTGQFVNDKIYERGLQQAIQVKHNLPITPYTTNRLIPPSGDFKFIGGITGSKKPKEPIYEEDDDYEEDVYIEPVPIVTSNKKSDTYHDVLGQLNSMIGLVSVKNEVLLLANLMRVMRLKQQDGLKVTMPNLHLVFTGNAGTGKTTVAQFIGSIYKNIGLLSNGHTVIVSPRQHLISEFIGQTAKKTQAVIEQSIGGVLFIDEAYSLFNGGDNPRDFGPEAIATIIQEMENRRGQFIIIMAGYTEDMDRLLNTNQGLKSRFSNFIDFPDYTLQELVEIFETMCKERQYILAPGVVEKASEQLRRAKEHFKTRFGNAREVRNLIERTEKIQAIRINQIDMERIPKPQRNLLLRTIKPEDIIDYHFPPVADERRRIGF